MVFFPVLGFDPDNIPMDSVYGDLLGNPDKLSPDVKAYMIEISKKQKGKPINKVQFSMFHVLSYYLLLLPFSEIKAMKFIPEHLFI